MTSFTWTPCRKRRVVKVLKHSLLVKLCSEKNQSLCKVNIMPWSWCREIRIVNVLKHLRWSSCFFFLWKQHQSLRYVNILLHERHCRERPVVGVLIHSRWLNCDLKKKIINFVPWTSTRERHIVNVMSWTSWNIHVGRGVFFLKNQHRFVIVMPWTVF